MRKCIGCGAMGDYNPKQARCGTCIAAVNRAYYERNRDHIKKQTKAYREKNMDWSRSYMRDYQHERHRQFKAEILAHYGDRCACCGESNSAFLTIDHVNNDGRAHRRHILGRNFYHWLKLNNFPSEPKLQTLCFNCNLGKHHNGGVCPHQALNVQRLGRKPVGPSGSKREAPRTEAMI